jgi:hypothetical protein
MRMWINAERLGHITDCAPNCTQSARIVAPSVREAQVLRATIAALVHLWTASVRAMRATQVLYADTRVF